jgi:hypothetical protein
MARSSRYLLALFFMMMSCMCSAQNARSLFDSGKGVVFEAEAPSEVSDIDLSDSDDLPKEASPRSEQDPEYSAEKSALPSPSSDLKPTDSKHASAVSAVPKPDKEDFSGLSYTIFKESSWQTFEAINPSTVFLSGDRIRVEVTSNKSGTLIVGNINPQGEATLLSVEGVRAGSTTRIPQNGALKFVGKPGTEKLVFVLSREAFSTDTSRSYESYITYCKTSSNTRSLVVDDSAGNQFQLINADGKCSVGKNNGAATTRSIVVDLDENSGYGVVPDENLTSGQLLSLIVNLNHR